MNISAPKPGHHLHEGLEGSAGFNVQAGGEVAGFLVHAGDDLFTVATDEVAREMRSASGGLAASLLARSSVCASTRCGSTTLKTRPASLASSPEKEFAGGEHGEGALGAHDARREQWRRPPQA